jgi:hypothetical protein
LEGEREMLEGGIGFEGTRNPWNGAFSEVIKEIRVKLRTVFGEWRRDEKLSGFNKEVLFGSKVLIYKIYVYVFFC